MSDDYFEHAQKEMLPKMKASALSIHINSKNPDIKLCAELGAAILFDKPIIVLVPSDAPPLSANLKRVASFIVQGDVNDPETLKKLSDAIQSLTSEDKRAQ